MSSYLKIEPVAIEDQLAPIDLRIINEFNYRNFPQRLHEGIDSEYNAHIIECTLNYLRSMNA